jgi:hypothetical protein
MNEELWECVPITLPYGFRMVATVDRPGGDIYDLGQNAEGQFRLFRRKRDPFLFYSHGKPEILSDLDLAGFGLSRSDSCEPERAEEEGEFSSLCRSHLIVVP